MCGFPRAPRVVYVFCSQVASPVFQSTGLVAATSEMKAGSLQGVVACQPGMHRGLGIEDFAALEPVLQRVRLLFQRD
jgi:hypothetical protein